MRNDSEHHARIVLSREVQIQTTHTYTTEQALDRRRLGLGADAMSRALVVPQAEDPTRHTLR
jgi:hypothetical protein